MAVRRVGHRAWTRWLSGEMTLARAMSVRREVRAELLWEAAKRLEEDQFAEAHRLFDLVVLFWPDSVDGHLGSGVCAMKLDRVDEAIRSFRTVEQIDDSNPYALANLAECALIQGDGEEATRLLDRIDGLGDPRNSGLRERLATLRQLVSTSTPPVG